VYACDHFVYPDYFRGNILHRPLAAMVEDPVQTQFGNDKREALPEVCRRCPWQMACHGDCPKHRFLRDRLTDLPRSYLCEGYRRFFAHADPWLKKIAALIRAGIPASHIMEIAIQEDLAAAGTGAVGRNDPCPCGSGRKFKLCHGRLRT